MFGKSLVTQACGEVAVQFAARCCPVNIYVVVILMVLVQQFWRLQQRHVATKPATHGAAAGEFRDQFSLELVNVCRHQAHAGFTEAVIQGAAALQG